jgi:hypothetical protein
MMRIKGMAMALAGLAAAIALGAAQRAPAPRATALSAAAPGLWEFAGAPGLKGPVRECIADIMQLAQFEHRRKTCTRTVVHDGSSSAVVHYTCGASEFGESRLTPLTPRSVRIETQGISDELPFNYVLQARRVGDCPVTAAAH